MKKPYYQDNHIRIYNKDCRDMSELANNSVQCVVTSPPYWGLRKYSGEQELIWGDNNCEHQWISKEHKDTRGIEGSGLSGHIPYKEGEARINYKDGFCSLCGAWKGAYGLEPTPEMYIEHTIEILREIRRVLRSDGVCFFNLGDSYAGSWGNSGSRAGGQRAKSVDKFDRPGYDNHTERPASSYSHPYLKPKDLCLIPFRVAIAAQKPYQEFTIKRLEDRAWLAGIIDADGCIGIHHINRGTYHQFQPFVSVGCSDEIMVKRCASITRCNGSRQVNRPEVDKRGIKASRLHYEWRLEGENAAKILGDIYPYLIVKEKQARVAYALWRNIQDTKELHKGKGHKTPESVVRDRLDLWQLIKKCNQREDIDVNLPAVLQHIEPGWWVRSVIIWSKPNPMPESVTDRPTESHEYILMLTKSAKYYWDADAVREPHIRLWNPETNNPGQLAGQGKYHDDGYGQDPPHGFANEPNPSGRNIRTVWEFPTQPYPEAHFAVFPEKLPEICIKAATPEVGCCSKCGAPWERVTENKPMEIRRTDWGDKAGNRTASSGTMISSPETTTLGWQPTCKCNADKVPSIVLDPFMGAGTTLWVAKKLNRQAVGYEISEEYCQLTVDRNRQQVLV